MDAQVGH